MISPAGTPARLLGEWEQGAFDLIGSTGLIQELTRALAYPKLSKLVDARRATDFTRWLATTADLQRDPESRPRAAQSTDPADDYLLALAESSQAVLVSGDKHLLNLRSEGLPIYSPAEFLALVAED